MNKSDIIIIGAGPAGYKAAEYAAKNGLSVTVFEKSDIGGTCLNAGCIPTKTLAHIAEVIISLSHSDTFGLCDLSYYIDYLKVFERQKSVVNSLKNGIEYLLDKPNINVIRTTASFIDEKTVVADNVEYCADNILIATGSQNKPLNDSVKQCINICDSTDLLHLCSLPKSICIIGAGVIGMEFASIFNAFGVDVYVIEFLKECLPSLDSEISKRLRKCLEKRGIHFYLQSAVTEINENGVIFKDRKDVLHTINSEIVLAAVGRKPNVDGLNLNAINVELDNCAIPVDKDYFNVISKDGALKNVYAVGDVNGIQMLAHAAEMQAIHVINHILDIHDNIRFDVMPAAIFTNPEAAAVGSTEDECKSMGVDFCLKKSYWRANGKAKAMNEDDGMLKIIFDKNGYILGAHAFGAHSADIIQELSVLMCKDTTLQQLKDMIHIHPTFSEIIKAALD